MVVRSILSINYLYILFCRWWLLCSVLSTWPQSSPNKNKLSHDACRPTASNSFHIFVYIFPMRNSIGFIFHSNGMDLNRRFELRKRRVRFISPSRIHFIHRLCAESGEWDSHALHARHTRVEANTCCWRLLGMASLRTILIHPRYSEHEHVCSVHLNFERSKSYHPTAITTSNWFSRETWANARIK